MAKADTVEMDIYWLPFFVASVSLANTTPVRTGLAHFAAETQRAFHVSYSWEQKLQKKKSLIGCQLSDTNAVSFKWQKHT